MVVLSINLYIANPLVAHSPQTPFVEIPLDDQPR